MPFALRTSTLGLLLAFALPLGGCSSSGSAVDAGPDVPVTPLSCGATEDCASGGVDVDGGPTYTCVFPSDVGGCTAYGHCQVLTLSTTSPTCETTQEICPCSGGTQVIPPCWPKGLTPYPIQSLGPCPGDGGS